MTLVPLDSLGLQTELHLLAELGADLAELGDAKADRLRHDRLALRAAERILTQVVEVTASICGRVVGSRVPVAPSTHRGVFVAAGELRVIPLDLAPSLISAAATADLLHHDYARVDVDVVALAVTTARMDVAAFADAIAAYTSALE